MVILKKLSSQLILILIIFVVLELISIKIFPEYSQNQKYKKLKNSNEKELSVIQKGKYQHFELIGDLKIRSDKNDINEKLKEKFTKIWIFGDSVTSGYGLKYTDTFFYSLDKLLNINEKKFNIFPVTRNASTFDDLVTAVENTQKIFNENDFIVSQFNFDDIVPPVKSENKKKIKTKKKNLIGKISSSINRFRFEYLHELTFIRVLTHYVSIMKKKTSGDCKKRGIDALSHYSYSYGSINYLEESKLAWKNFEERLLKLKKISQKKNFKLIILISPISLQIENHEKINFYNLDLKCSKINAREKLLKLLTFHNIPYSDPLSLFNETMKTDIAENNFEPFFIEYDTIHPNTKGSLLIAISLYKSILNY